ncbi:glycoside hydrolase family 13 protein [Fistulina hepatica ATCC 64428]|uniref:Alpha-amylase n=1 Tax=Fistulina hepatica ATCC 64428 TaxID=1128425 RepID=A0A0D7A7Y2_9AGAR|nr:glycoside hydrolase family 13 protein [Fistulina hepatica ATCC 64428]
MPTAGVIAQMFQWSWTSIAQECTNFLGPAGYGYVQVSPPMEHIAGEQWWTDYQPVSYNLTSKHGTRDEFASMIQQCHDADVQIVVDAVFNHMTAQQNGTGIAGTKFTHYYYPGNYGYQNFHHCPPVNGSYAMDFNNRTSVQECELLGLADLATETEDVQSRLAAYGNDLLSLSVDGLRLDAAKHIPTGDIANILSRLNGTKRPYITQEITYNGAEAVRPSEYVQNGMFRYPLAFLQAFSNDSVGISSLRDMGSLGWVPSWDANIFVANHDTERSGTSLNFSSPANAYVLAHVLSLAHPYGRPTVLSSYAFDTTDDGAPMDGQGTCQVTSGANRWLCQHRWPAIAGMVGFRNNVQNASLTNWASPSPQQIAFGRDRTGYVAINNADTHWRTQFNTSLPDGHYCNVVDGVSQNGVSCTGSSYLRSSSFIVHNGAFTATLYPRTALAMHTGSLGSAPGASGNVSLTFDLSPPPIDDSLEFYVLGNVTELGSWNTSYAIELTEQSGGSWDTIVVLPAGTLIEYSYLRRVGNGSVSSWLHCLTTPLHTRRFSSS